MADRVFGKISFPNTEIGLIENVWLNIEKSSIFLEVPWTGHRVDTLGIVLGEFIGLGEVTFIGARLSGGSSGSGNSYRRMYVTSMLKGIQIKNNEDLLFKEVDLESPALLNWIREDHWIERVDRSYSVPEVLKIIDEKFGDVQITIALTHSVDSDYNLVCIKHKCYVRLSFSQEVHLNEISSRIILMRKLILFLTNSEPNFIEQVLVNETDKFEILTPFQQLDEANFSQYIYIDYYSLIPHLSSIMKMWFESAKLHPIVDLVLEIYFNTSLSFARHYQNLCGALESFHEIFIEKKVALVDEKCEANKHQIIGLLEFDEHLKKWFIEKSRFWDKPEFIDRLVKFKDIIQFLAEDIIDCDIDDLLQKIKQTRNEITHTGVWNKRFKLRVELIIVSKILEFTLKLEILKLSGVDIKSGNRSLLDEAKNKIKILASGNNYTSRPDRLRREKNK